MFMLRKPRGISMDNQKDWLKDIQSIKISGKMKDVISYLHWNLKKDALVDLPSQTSSHVQNGFRKIIRESCKKVELSEPDLENVKILVPLTDNPNAPNKYREIPIYKAAHYGRTEIFKILAPQTDNPNAPNEFRNTPVHMASCKGHTEIVKILAPLAKNPNAQTESGWTP